MGLKTKRVNWIKNIFNRARLKLMLSIIIFLLKANILLWIDWNPMTITRKIEKNIEMRRSGDSQWGFPYEVWLFESSPTDGLKLLNSGSVPELKSIFHKNKLKLACTRLYVELSLFELGHPLTKCLSIHLFVLWIGTNEMLREIKR